MTKQKSQFPKKYRCIVDFVFWKGEQVFAGQEIEVTKIDWENQGLRKKLKRAFRPVETIVSEPIKLISEKEAEEKIKEK